MSRHAEPQSKLTRERPDLWRQTVRMATDFTGYVYAPKLPLADGTIYACGKHVVPGTKDYLDELIDRYNKLKIHYEDASDPTFKEELKKKVDIVKKEIDELKKPTELDNNDAHRIKTKQIDDLTTEIAEHESRIVRMRREIAENEESIKKLQQIIDEKKKNIQQINVSLQMAPVVVVPEGAMEWILHEVGHYVAATPEERLLPNYGLSASETGHDGEREWQAWAFEEIILAPYGPARHFAPPTQRDGAAFLKAGPMPQAALRHIEKQMLELRVDISQWRAVYGQWVRWESERLWS